MRARWDGLAEIGGVPSTLSSPGREMRATALQGLVRDAHHYLVMSLGNDFAPLVVVVDESDWAKGGEDAPPYGIPYASHSDLELVVPADPQRNPLIDTYARHAPRNSAERFADLIAIHELGHLHLRASGLDLPPGWLGEFMATDLACCFLVEHRPEDAALWYSLSRAHAEATTPRHRSLEMLDELYFGVGPDNYIWYQNELTRMVEQVQAACGLEFALRLVSAGLGPTSDGPSMLAAAERAHPGFRTWAASLRRP